MRVLSLVASMQDVEAETLQDALERIEQLEAALDSRIIIEQAKGVLAGRLSITIQEAFLLLRDGARSTRMDMRVLAYQVVEEKRLPLPILISLARQQRLRSAWMRELNEA